MNDDEKRLEERKKYVNAFNTTMIKIWKERIIKLGVIDTGALYNSLLAISMKTLAPDYSAVSLAQEFMSYGFYSDFGTGRNTPVGNGGDSGHPNNRKKKRWFSTKHYGSVMNIREFYADNLGKFTADVISNALSPAMARHLAVNNQNDVFL